MTNKQKHPMRCVIVTSCKECPWRTCTTMPGIEDNPDGTPKRLIWCLGKDNSRIDLKEEDLYTIHHDCPLPITNCSHSDMAHHDEQVRRKVLDDLARYIQKHTHCCSTMPLLVVSKEPLLVFIQSLRQSSKKDSDGSE